MKTCKVNGCNRKYEAKGYCKLHYSRARFGNSPIRLCSVCGDELPLHQRKYCVECAKEKKRRYFLEYHKKNITSFSFLGKTINVFTNGVTEEIKPFVPLIKKKVLKDCIDNPRKYLGD